MIAAESLRNLNMNGDQMFGVLSGCIFYVLIAQEVPPVTENVTRNMSTNLKLQNFQCWKFLARGKGTGTRD